jgi:Carboxypeptidase regulatory-like domain
VLAVNTRLIRSTVLGIAAVLAGVVVTVPAATPGYAAPSLTMQLSPSSVDLGGGDSRTMTVTLTNSGLPARVRLTVSAPTGLSGDVGVSSADSSCTGSGTTLSCTVDLAAGSRTSVAFSLTAKNPDSVGTGQHRTDTTGTVVAAVGPESTTLPYTVTLRGPAASASPGQAASGSSGVSEVSGTVVDASTGQPVPGATVDLRDGAGLTREVGADSSGRYRFASSASQQITPGTLTLSAGADGYGYGLATETIEARAGRSYTGIRLALTAPAGADPVASDSAAADTSPASGTPGRTWLLIGLGLLLVAAGTAILALLVARWRRNRPAAPYESWPGADPWAGR